MWSLQPQMNFVRLTMSFTKVNFTLNINSKFALLLQTIVKKTLIFLLTNMSMIERAPIIRINVHYCGIA